MKGGTKMSSSSKEGAKQRILETIFEYAGLCHVENIIKEIQDEANSWDEPMHFPEELDEKMRKIIANYNSNYNRKTKTRRGRKTAKKVLSIAAVILIAILTATAVFVASAEAIRIKVLNLVMEDMGEYTSVDIKEEPEASEDILATVPPNWEGQYAPTYIPEDFVISQYKSYNHTKTIVYLDDSGQMILFEERSGEISSLRLDTEYTDATPIEINGFEGLLVEKDGIVKITWYNDELLFAITGKIDKNELIRIAESVELIK